MNQPLPCVSGCHVCYFPCCILYIVIYWCLRLHTFGFSSTPLVYPLTWPPRLSRWGYCLVQVLVWGLYPNGCHLLMSQLQIIISYLLMLMVMYVCIVTFDFLYKLCMSHLVYCGFLIHVHSMVDSYCKRMRCWFQKQICVWCRYGGVVPFCYLFPSVLFKSIVAYYSSHSPSIFCFWGFLVSTTRGGFQCFIFKSVPKILLIYVVFWFHPQINCTTWYIFYMYSFRT